jgi:hypothetical protein
MASFALMNRLMPRATRVLRACRGVGPITASRKPVASRGVVIPPEKASTVEPAKVIIGCDTPITITVWVAWGMAAGAIALVGGLGWGIVNVTHIVTRGLTELDNVKNEVKDIGKKVAKEIKKVDSKVEREIKKFDSNLGSKIDDVRRDIQSYVDKIDLKMEMKDLAIRDELFRLVGGDKPEQMVATSPKSEDAGKRR